MSDKQNPDYHEKYRFYTEQALNQFGNASNFFFAISFAFLSYSVGSLSFSFCTLGMSILLISALASLGSVIFSAITVLCRLHDARLTRHISRIRKKYFRSEEKMLDYSYIDIESDKFYKCLKNFISTVRKDDYFISDSDMKVEQTLNEKFFKLRKRTHLLSKFSWVTFNWQIIALMFSLILYVISKLIS